MFTAIMRIKDIKLKLIPNGVKERGYFIRATAFSTGLLNWSDLNRTCCN